MTIVKGLLDGVDQRTQLAGHNRFELLLFRLGGHQRFGINVFKVQEVIQCPPLNHLPQSHPVICGVAHLRGKTVPVLDLSMAVGLGRATDADKSYVIVTEYNRTIQGFLVGSVDRIINIGWAEVKAPPSGLGREGYLTAVTEIDGDLIEVIDVEKIMKEVVGLREQANESAIDQTIQGAGSRILIIDDSMVARTQLKRVCDQLQLEYDVLKDGQDAWDHLCRLVQQGIVVEDHYAMIISDVEMPRMDGYTLATKVKGDPSLKGLYFVLHTSLSGVFNSSMVEKVGANEFLAKFEPDELVQTIQRRLQAFHQRAAV